MANKIDASTSSKSAKPRDLDLGSSLNRAKKLRQIAEILDLLIVYSDSNKNAIVNKFVNKQKEIASNGTTTNRLPRPRIYDILDIILGEETELLMLRSHYQQCPWFYDTAGSCVSLPIYGSSQHKFVKQYYKKPQLWHRRGHNESNR